MENKGKTYRDRVSQLISWGHWFSFFNIITTMLLGTRYIVHFSWSETLLGQIYQLLTWVGHFWFLVFAVYILILFPASFIIPSQRVMRLFAVLVATISITMLLIDIYAFETLHLHLNPLVWELLLNSEKTNMNVHSMNVQWQCLFIIVPAILFLEVAISEWVWRKLRSLLRKRIGVPLSVVFIVSFITSHLIHIWADASFYSPITTKRSNFPISYPMTAKTFMEKYGLLDRQEYQYQRDEIDPQDSKVIRYPLDKISFSPNANNSQLNLLMVMVDSLRADMLNYLSMPNLNQFANDNINFKNHFSSSNNAMGSIFSLFYGLPSSYAQRARTEGLNPLLIDTLNNKGYRLGLFSADNFTNPIYCQSIFGKYRSDAAKLEINNTWISDSTATSALTMWINEKNTDKPWFAYLELKSLTNHEKSGEYNHNRSSLTSLDDKRASMGDNTALVLKTSYNNAAYYVDKLLGELFISLEVKGQLDNTIVMVTANHGTEFNETGSNSWGANSNYSKYQLQVPLVVHWPNEPPQVIDMYSSHFDIVPTLMESMLSVDSPPEIYASGRNLFNLVEKPHKWLLAGNERDIVVVLPDKTIVVDKFGNYLVYDSNYKLQPEEKPQLLVLMQVIQELKRFNYPNELTSRIRN
ncbi:DUF3413 domain-containing protein [Candidatus Enterovibrio escicola]|uniref:Hydrolase of alkaline phosphatase n=2 Tax=Candidatus Enterovibrio escicola TaxID=1927127 RepID=A0A2A5T378_9GAMM|nr:DUF3413 domain-containing protein [Candidatus Enterovibrio escacola]PCS22580.1 hydrolase of alkaline phosphatase [Candidatus Enterovibrio escacola]